MPVDNIMSHAPISVHMDDRLAAVQQIFAEQDFHHIPVVNDDKVLVGVVTRSDYFAAVSPFALTAAEQQRDANTLNKRVHQIMSRNPAVVYPDTNIKMAAQIILDQGISCVAVINEANKLVGILTWRDLLQFAINR